MKNEISVSQEVKNDSKKKKKDVKTRNSVSSLTKMFETNNPQLERRSTQVRPTNKIKSIQEQSNLPQTEDNSRKRSSTILEKINLFNQITPSASSVKVNEAITVVPALDYKKVLDEDTGKSIWINNKSNLSKKEDNFSSSMGMIRSSSSKEFEIEKPLMKTKNEDNTINMRKSVSQIIKTIESTNIDKKGFINSETENVNDANKDRIQQDCIKEVRDDESKCSEGENSNSLCVSLQICDDQNELEKKVDQETTEITDFKSFYNDCEIRNENKNELKELDENINKFSDQNNLVAVPIRIETSVSPTKIIPLSILSPKNQTALLLDNILDNINYKSNINELNVLAKESVELINLKNKSEQPEKDDEYSINQNSSIVNPQEGDRKITLNKSNQKGLEIEVVELLEEEKNLNTNKLTDFAQKNNYNEIINNNLNNSETTLNISNEELSQDYNTLPSTSTIRSVNDNVLFSERKTKIGNSSSINSQEDDIIEVTASENNIKENLVSVRSKKLRNFFTRYKYVIISILITLVLVIIISHVV